MDERSKYITRKNFWQASINRLPNNSDNTEARQEALYDPARAELATRIEDAMRGHHPESWWQSFITENILKLWPQYVYCYPSINLINGGTKYPDFLLETYDGFLDVLEIKKPDTPLLKEDRSHRNYYWSDSLARAISQIAHYLNDIEKHSFAICDYLRNAHNTEVKITKPKGIILAGDMRSLSQEARNDFRLLSQLLNGIECKTYDNLLVNAIGS